MTPVVWGYKNSPALRVVVELTLKQGGVRNLTVAVPSGYPINRLWSHLLSTGHYSQVEIYAEENN